MFPVNRAYRKRCAALTGNNQINVVLTDSLCGFQSVSTGNPVADADVSYIIPVTPTAGVFFSDGFESGNFSKSENKFIWSDGTWCTVSTENPKTGDYSARFLFNGDTDILGDAFSEKRFNLGGSYDDLWVKFDLYVPANYTHRDPPSGGDNNKFIYLWSGSYSSNFTGPGLSIQNWAANGESQAIPKAKGSPDGAGGFLFDQHYWNDGGRFIKMSDVGKWLTIIVHAKYASASNNDGVFQLWKITDGQLFTVFDKRDGDWYVPGQVGFDQGYLLGWANSGFDEDTIMHIDNIVFSTERLL